VYRQKAFLVSSTFDSIFTAAAETLFETFKKPVVYTTGAGVESTFQGAVRIYQTDPDQDLQGDREDWRAEITFRTADIPEFDKDASVLLDGNYYGATFQAYRNAALTKIVFKRVVQHTTSPGRFRRNA
jgi:hypothetical protein